MSSRTTDWIDGHLSGSSLIEDLPEAEHRRLLGYPPSAAPEGRAVGTAAEARAWYAANGRPWIRFREMAIASVEGSQVRLEDGSLLACPVLADRFLMSEAHALVVVGAGAGPEVESECAVRWRTDRPDEAFALDAFASAVTEHLVRAAGVRLCAWAEPRSEAVLARYSPGYAGWDLRDQAILFRLLSPIPLELLPSSMLAPRHSQLTVFGLTRRADVLGRAEPLCPCVSCALPGCAYRRMAHRPSPSYAFPPKALSRWARELKLERREDGAARARFRYRGSSCSNGGVPLEFDFEVEVAPASQGRSIRSLSCAPASGDRGYRATCAFQEDPARFLKEVDETRPLLGRPLEEALSWNPPLCPAACLCTPSHRNHKWRIVLQTLHFALEGRKGGPG